MSDTDKSTTLLTDTLKRLEADAKEFDKLLLSCAEKFLMIDDKGIIMNSCMSTEEVLCALLVKRNLIEATGTDMFRVVTQLARKKW